MSRIHPYVKLQKYASFALISRLERSKGKNLEIHVDIKLIATGNCSE